MVAALILPWAGAALAGRVQCVVIGDSLSAEYLGVPEYGLLTVAGWQSQSWVEVLAERRSAQLDFGGYQPLQSMWDLVRLYGYEFNWAVPGAEAEDYRRYWSDPLNPFYPFLADNFVVYPTLDDHLRDVAEAVVVFLGGNDIREDYGRIAGGGSYTALVAEVRAAVEWIIGRIRARDSNVPVVLATVPDLGASPAMKADYPDPVARARVSLAVAALNAEYAALATRYGLKLADVCALTRDLIAGQTIYYGAVPMIDAADPDNNPRYLFCRDGFHPNRAGQIRIANTILAAMAAATGKALPPVGDAEALAMLGLNPDLPYYEWIAGFAVGGSTGMLADADGDGATNLAEYAFSTGPDNGSATPGPTLAVAGGPSPRSGGPIRRGHAMCG